MEEDRVILHCDCNCFFASVEMMRHPEWRNVPLAVCGSEEDRHGIVLAKNELARRCDVRTAETVRSAKSKCPALVTVEPHYREYVEVSRRVCAIYERYTDLIEPFGIDECWLDVTGSRRLFGDGCAIAESIRRAIREEIGITVSVGVSFNKVFAKLGSDYKKPDAVTVISRENFRDIVFPMPVDALLFVGRRTAEALKQMGIRTVGELAHFSRSLLESRLGKSGAMLHDYANGLDDEPVRSYYEHTEAKSVGNGMTFRHDLSTTEEIRVGLEFLSAEVGERLRCQRQKCTTVGVTLKNEHLSSTTRQGSVHPATSLSAEIAAAAYRLLSDIWHPGVRVRSLTVTAMNLIHDGEETEQIDMFDTGRSERRERRERLEGTLDGIRARFGHTAIGSGAVIRNDLGIPEKSEPGDKTEN